MDVADLLNHIVLYLLGFWVGYMWGTDKNKL